jgi:hypothetical protein
VHAGAHRAELRPVNSIVVSLRKRYRIEGWRKHRRRFSRLPALTERVVPCSGGRVGDYTLRPAAFAPPAHAGASAEWPVGSSVVMNPALIVVSASMVPHPANGAGGYAPRISAASSIKN